MKLIVDLPQRYAKMRAHTATHLLHAQLCEIFPDTKQEWSFVDEDYLRLDFFTKRSLTQEEILQIQNNVNKQIYSALPVDTIETSYDEAIKLGAKAFFEDKYGDEVRVIKIGEGVSVELCGGTHVKNTSEIGGFVIVAQESVASWIKRIVAYTGPKLSEYLQQKDLLLEDLAQKFGVNSKQLVDKAEKVIKDYEELQKSYEQLESKLIRDVIQKLVNKTNNSDLDFVLEIPKDINFKTAIFQAKHLFENQNFLIYNLDWNFALSTKDAVAKNIAQSLNLKWWWSDFMVQGRDIAVVWMF